MLAVLDYPPDHLIIVVLATRRPFGALSSSDESEGESPPTVRGERSTATATEASAAPGAQTQQPGASSASSPTQQQRGQGPPARKRRRTSAYNPGSEIPASAAFLHPQSASGAGSSITDNMRIEKNGMSSQSSAVDGASALQGSNGASLAFASTDGNGPSLGRNGKLEDGSTASSFTMLPQPAPTYFGHDREEITRILIQSLEDLGYERAARVLEEQSEYTLDSPEVSEFRSTVLGGKWNKAEGLLFGMELTKDADINVRFR